MDYWALGHVHAPGRVADDPVVIYAGSPQGLNPKERGEHGCYLIEIAGGVVREEFVALDSVRWASVELAADEFDTIESLRAGVVRACAALLDGQDRPLVVRADIKGTTEIHSTLVRPGTLADLAESIRDELLDGDQWVFLDRLRDLTSPALDIDRLREGGGFAADLVQLAEELLADPAATAELFDEAMSPVADRAQDVDPGIAPADALRRARDLCLERLLAEEEM